MHGRRPGFAGVPAWRIGVAAALRPLPRWKHAADFIFSQVSYSADAQLRWRDANPADVPVYAGVMVLASAAMARRLAATIPDIEIPGWLTDKFGKRQDGRRRGCLPADRPAPRQRCLRRRPPHSRQPLPGSLRTPGNAHLTSPGQFLTAACTITGHPAYGLHALRTDLGRFTFRLGGADGEDLFGQY